MSKTKTSLMIGKRNSLRLFLPYLAMTFLSLEYAAGAAKGEASAWLAEFKHPNIPLLGTMPYFEGPLPEDTFRLRIDDPTFRPRLKDPLEPSATIEHLALSSDGKLLAWSNSRGRLCVSSKPEGRLLLNETFDGENICCVELSPDNRWLLAVPLEDPKSGSGEAMKQSRSEAVLYDLTEGTKISLASSCLVDWAFSPDSSRLICSEYSSNPEESYQGYKEIELPGQKKYSFQIGPQGGLDLLNGIAGCSRDSGLRFLDPQRVIVHVTIADWKKGIRTQRILEWNMNTGAAEWVDPGDLEAFLPNRPSRELIRSWVAALKSAESTAFRNNGNILEGQERAAFISRTQNFGDSSSSSIRSYLGWAPLAVSRIGDRRITVYGKEMSGIDFDHPECSGDCRIVVEKEDGSLAADKIIPFSDFNSHGYPVQPFIEDDGSITFAARGMGIGILIVNPELTLCKQINYPSIEENVGLLPFPYSEGNGRETLGHFFAYNGVSKDGVRFDPTEKFDIFNTLPLGATRNYILPYCEDVFLTEGLDAEVVSGVQILGKSGEFLGSLILAEGDDERCELEGSTVWEEADGSLVFVLNYSTMMRVSRQFSLPGLRFIKLSPTGELSSKFYEFPFPELPKAGTPDGRYYWKCDREGATLRYQADSSSDVRLPTLCRVVFPIGPAGKPDPFAGQPVMLSVPDPLYALNESGLWLDEGFLARGCLSALMNTRDSGVALLRLSAEDIRKYGSIVFPKEVPERRKPELSSESWAEWNPSVVAAHCKEIPLADAGEEPVPMNIQILPYQGKGRPKTVFLGACTDADVRVRSLPSNSGLILGKLTKGEFLLILEKGAKPEAIGGKTAVWVRVRTAEGLEGWVFSAFVEMGKEDL
jgi:hypothetical protein